MFDDTTTPRVASPVAVVDRRTARRLALAERQRLDADAELDRRGRAALQDLELAEARRSAEQRRRDTRRRQVLARRNGRKARRAVRRTRARAALPRWAERALFVGPICFPMAVAWIGQIQYARTVMGWPLPGAVVFAAGFELSTVYVARLDWKARGEGDNSLVFRAATWMFATLAATMNYWHAADPGLRPNGEAVSYGAMSIAGILLWELLSTFRHRGRLAAAGILPPRQPRFGLARWLWFPRVTHLARLLALRDGYTLTGDAWQAALDAAGLRGSVRAAIAALRGRLGPPTSCSCAAGATLVETAVSGGDESEVETPVETVEQTVAAWPVETTNQPGVATAVETLVETSQDDAAETHVETLGSAGATGQTPERLPGAAAGTATVEPGAAAHRYTGNGHRAADEHGEPDRDASERTKGSRLAPRGRRASRRAGGVKDKMIRYVERQRGAGQVVTGAELDRRFGTVNYGSRILRELDAQRDT
jgi:hypothetical protein